MTLKLAGLIVSSGATTSALIDDALQRQVLAGGSLDTALLELNALTEEDCLAMLSRASGHPAATAQVLQNADREFASRFPARLAEKYCLLPLRAAGHVVHVASSYPLDDQRIDQIGELLGCAIQPFVALEVRLRETIAQMFGHPLGPRFWALAAALDPDGARRLAPAASAAAPPKKRPEPLAARSLDDGLAAQLADALESPPPAAAPRPGAPSRTARAEAPLTLAQAKAALEHAFDRDAIIEVALRFAYRTFDFAAAFAVVGGSAVGWAAMGAGEGLGERIAHLTVPLDAPSVLRTVLATRGRYLGPVPPDARSRALVAAMGRPRPTAAFFYPVTVRDRPVAILYGDVVGRPVHTRRVQEFVVLADQLGARFEQLILEKKRDLAIATGDLVPPPLFVRPHAKGKKAGARRREPAAPRPTGPTSAELFARGPLPLAAADPEREGPALGGPHGDAARRASPAPAPGMSRLLSALKKDGPGPETSPQSTTLPSMADLFGSLERLLGPDVGDRARALGELSRQPALAAAMLIARFPGPLLRARVAVKELPRPEELGPIPSALARMGLPSALALIPVLEHKDVEHRYFGCLTAGSLPFPPLVLPLVHRVFDQNAAVANAARVALAAMQGVPGFDEALARLRVALINREPDTSAQAARALGALHDLTCIEGLIHLTGHDHRTLAQAAADALWEICKQSYGLAPRKWATWWSEHKGRPRLDWLVEALHHRDRDIRVSTIDELVRIAKDNFGYFADAPAAEREIAIARWETWWLERGRAKGTIV